MARIGAVVLMLLALAFVPLSRRAVDIKVGSKKFTESVLLGEMLGILAEEAGVPATHYQELGGTQLVFQALLNGDVDIYPEYSGTIAEEIVGPEAGRSEAELRTALKARGVRMSRPLGFNNSYALAMLKSRAAELGVESISDLAKHPDLVFGFSNEFIDRNDGWPNLRRHYDLPQRDVSGLDHDLAYRQLQLGAIDLLDVYTTDAKIGVHDLTLLKDDLDYFPRYDAVLLYRSDLPSRYPNAANSMLRLENTVSEKEMIAANARVELDNVPETRVAADFLEQKFALDAEVAADSVAGRIRDRTIEHLDLVRKSLIPAILIAIPLGILAAAHRRVGHVVLGLVGIVQTIPSLALLVMLMPIIAHLGLATVGLGSMTAVTALFLYSLLPIVRNTHAGLHGIPAEHREAAAALGLPRGFRLLQIELPMASPSIIAGIKTAAIINIGFATLGALIGAGGYGQPIITGIRLNDTGLILEGAIPAALLALFVQGAFDIGELYVIPKGLQIRPGK